MKNLFNLRKCLLVIVYVLVSFSSQGQYIHRKPKTLPDLNFQTMDGKAYTNESLKKEANLLIFYLDPTCQICDKEMRQIMENKDKMDNTEILLISSHSREANEKFATKFNIAEHKNITFLEDRNDEFYKQFKVNAYPSLFLYNSNKELITDFDTYADIKEILDEFNSARR